MKNALRLLGIIVLTATIGLGMTTCGNETYTVTFDSNGGSAVASITGITSGETITAPAAPTKADYLFGG